MEAPKVIVCSKFEVSFEQKPPRLVRWGFHASPFKQLLIGLTPNGSLCRIEFARGRKPAAIVKEWQKEWPQTEFARDDKETASIAQKIFGSSRQKLKLHMTGTKFQHKVWKELIRIPAGQVVSYGDLARRIKMPKAARAIGAAMGANPIPILVPCHRVIAADGTLGGFTGGLPVKIALLGSEGVAI